MLCEYIDQGKFVVLHDELYYEHLSHYVSYNKRAGRIEIKILRPRPLAYWFANDEKYKAAYEEAAKSDTKVFIDRNVK